MISNSVFMKIPDFLRKWWTGKPADNSSQDTTHREGISTRKPKLGLALSCGGAKGLAHIGVLQVLEEEGIEISVVAGTSMGSYVAALWANQVTGGQMQKLAQQITDKNVLMRLADTAIPPVRGAFYGLKAKAHLEQTIGQSKFEELERKCLIISADLDTYERIVFREGQISDAVLASCAMPGIVVPPIVGDHRCTDGGVVDPVPVGALHKFTDCDHVIAVSTVRRLEDIDTHHEAMMHAEEDFQEESKPSLWRRAVGKLSYAINPAAEGNMIDTLRRSIRAAQIRMAHESCRKADLALYPGSQISAAWHDYQDFERYIELGRQAALDALPTIKKLSEPIPTTNDFEKKESMVGERVA